MSHIESSPLTKELLTKRTKDKLLAVGTAAVLFAPGGPIGPDTVNPESRSPIVAVGSSSENKNNVEKKPQKTLEQQALEFIMPDPQDARDAKKKPATLGEVDDPENQVGPISKERQKDDVYVTTWFGGYDDPNDNGIFKYEDELKEVLSNQSKTWKAAVEGKSGKELQSAVKYFSAGAGPKGEAQFEVGQKIKVTSPNGKVVIVVAGDEGPHLAVQQESAKFDISKRAWEALGEPEKVKAEPIPDHLEKFVGLGPVQVKKEVK